MKPILIKWVLFCLAVIVAGSAMLTIASASNQTMAEREEEILGECGEMSQLVLVGIAGFLVIEVILLIIFAIIHLFIKSEIVSEIFWALSEFVGSLVFICLAVLVFIALFASSHIVLR